ncbi:MAG: MFS transporter [Candidatus Levybacteria bacterium]|nr:MFS transporter [Candidatus Levybacteria bacterium]
MNALRKILLLSDAFFLLSGGLLGPIYALYVQKIGGDLLDASSTFAIFMITAGIIVFLLGMWEDKVKHQKKFVIAGYGIGMIGSLGYLFVSSTTGLFIVQAILGFAVAMKDPAYDALFSTSQKHLALAWGDWEAVDFLAIGIGAFVGGLIATNYGFPTLLFCLFLLSCGAFLASLYLLKFKNA